MACKKIALDGCSAQSSTIGRTQCKYFFPQSLNRLTILLNSVQAGIHDGLDGYNTADNYWIRCLYEGEKGNPNDIEEGFLKSTLLVKVCADGIVLTIPQTTNHRPRYSR